MSTTLTFPKRLKVKLLAIVGVAFLALIAPGFWLLLQTTSLADEELLAELGLPDPDVLKAGDDFSAFMSKSVPARLRNRALRKLWVSNPVLANLDDLVDYAEDFRSAGLTGEVIQTTYQVGKGLMKHVEALARIEDHDGSEEPVETAATEQDLAEDVIEEAAKADAYAPSEQEMEEVEMAVAAPKRRMRFVVGANT